MEEGVIRFLIPREAAVAGVGRAERDDYAQNCRSADDGSGPEYPARVHSHRVRDVKPFYQPPPPVPPVRTDVPMYGWHRLQ